MEHYVVVYEEIVERTTAKRREGRAEVGEAENPSTKERDHPREHCRQDGRGDVTRRSGQREEEKDGGFRAREVTSPRTDKRRSANAGYVCVVLCEHCNNVLFCRSPWPTSPRSATFAVRKSSTNLCTLPSRSGLTGFGKGKTPSFSSGAPNRLSITSDCTTPDEAQKTAAATSLHHSKKAPQLPGPSRQALTRKTAG